MVLWQKPNVLLWFWLVASIVARLLVAGKPHRLSEAVAYGSLFGWAYLEITDGVNYFRRALGLVILIAIILNKA